MKKTLIYGIVAVVILAILGIGAFLFFRTQGASTNGQGGGSNFFGSLFPFGQNGGGIGGNGSTPDGNDGFQSLPDDVSFFRKISAEPMSGGFVFYRDGVAIIRYVDRKSGHVYETPAEEAASVRISNTTIPGIQEVLWVDEDSLIVRYLEGDTLNTFYASLDSSEEGEQSLRGFFIDSFTHAALDPQRETLFSTTPQGGGSVFSVSDPDGEGARTVLETVLSSLVPLQSENALFVYTAPASGVAGFIYQVLSGSLVKIAGNIQGLTAQVNDTGTRVLVSGGGENEVALALVNVQTGEIVEGPVDTLSSKCVFVPGVPTSAYCGVPTTLPAGAYPNDWLLGRVSLSDTLWLVDFEAGTATLLVNPQDVAGEVIDVSNISVDAEGDYLLFTNKKDLSLWSLRLREKDFPEDEVQ